MAAARNQRDFDDIQLSPRSLINIEGRSLQHEFLGKTWGMPFGIAPMGMCNLSWPNADQFLGEAARQNEIPLACSTMASSSLEKISNWAGQNAWFQLYISGAVEQGFELVDRAEKSGYQTLILTVDVPEVAQRRRDLKNGFKVPFRIGPKQFLDFALHPFWSLSTLKAGAPETENTLAKPGEKAFDRYAGRGAIDWRFLQQLRDRWSGNLLVKGVMHPDDALKVKSMGADGIYVSNHGGRQLDSAPSSINLLSHIRQAVGQDCPLVLDSGVRSGEDIVRALASGADFVMLGRPFLYAIAANQRAGLDQIIELLKKETLVCMAQIGVNTVAEIGQHNIVQ